MPRRILSDVEATPKAMPIMIARLPAVRKTATYSVRFLILSGANGLESGIHDSEPVPGEGLAQEDDKGGRQQQNRLQVLCAESPKSGRSHIKREERKHRRLQRLEDRLIKPAERGAGRVVRTRPGVFRHVRLGEELPNHVLPMPLGPIVVHEKVVLLSRDRPLAQESHGQIKFLLGGRRNLVEKVLQGAGLPVVERAVGP